MFLKKQRFFVCASATVREAIIKAVPPEDVCTDLGFPTVQEAESYLRNQYPGIREASATKSSLWSMRFGWRKWRFIKRFELPGGWSIGRRYEIFEDLRA